MPLTPVRVMRVLPKALSFDGVDDYVKIPRVVQDDFSIEVLFRTMQTAGTGQWWAGNGIVDAEVCGPVNDFGLALVGSKVGFGVGNPDTTITSVKDVNDGIWHHVVAVRVKSTGEMRLYVDTELEATGTGNTNSLTDPPWIGIGNNPCDVGYNRRWFRGDVALVRIYSRALSEDEVRWNFYHMNDPVRDGLVLWLHWDSIDAEAGVWRDKSGYGNHGTIYGATPVDVIKKPVRILTPSRIISPPLR